MTPCPRASAGFYDAPVTIAPLARPGLRNARDLGGLRTVDGGQIRHGAVVRADSPHALTADGIAAPRAHGVTRIIDLHSADEAELRPNVLAGDPMYRLAPFTDPDDDPADELSDLAGVDVLDDDEHIVHPTDRHAVPLDILLRLGAVLWAVHLSSSMARVRREARRR